MASTPIYDKMVADKAAKDAKAKKALAPKKAPKAKETGLPKAKPVTKTNYKRGK